MSCGGYCCERFRIRSFNNGGDRSASPGDLMAEAARATGEYQVEALKVANMLVLLDYSRINGNGDLDDRPSYWFTCKFFDKVTRLCTIYDTRPKMCRNHGTDLRQTCLYTKCRLLEPVKEI